MPAPAPEVSVVIPTRNRWGLLERSLASALDQEHVDYEVLVVVDGGTDDTERRLRERDDPRVRVLSLQASQGVARARNLGASEARGAWLAFLDDDDLWAPWRLRALLDRADGAGLVVGGTVSVDERGLVLGVSALTPDGAALPARLRRMNVIGGPSSAIVRRDAFTAVGGFDPELAVLADWDLWLRVVERYPVAVDPALVNAYLVHPGGMHHSHAARAVRELRAIAAKHARSREGEAFAASDEEFRRWLAHVLRRSGRRGPAARAYARNAVRYRDPVDLAKAGLALLAGPRVNRALAARRAPPAPAWLGRYGLGKGARAR